MVPDDFIEMEAKKVLAAAKDANAANTALNYSIAISLKRIADSLAKIGNAAEQQFEWRSEHWSD